MLLPGTNIHTAEKGHRGRKPEGSIVQFLRAINNCFIESPPSPMIFHVSEVVNNRQIHSYILHCFIYSPPNLLPLHRTHKYPKSFGGQFSSNPARERNIAGDFSYSRVYLQLHIALLWARTFDVRAAPKRTLQMC